MNLSEARHECRRYLHHNEIQRRKAEALTKLASDRRAGRVSAAEARKRLNEISGPSPTVYDGAQLEKAVEVMLKATEPQMVGSGE